MDKKTVIKICGACGAVTVIAIIIMLIVLQQDSGKEGTGSESEKKQETSQIAESWSLEEIEKCMTIGNYKEQEGEREVYTLKDITDEDVEYEISTVLDTYAEYQEVNRGAKKGDICNINFTGTINGKVEDSATYTDEAGYEFELGSQEFFDDFEKAILGMKPGETKSADMTFPEDDEDYAGQKVTFEITMNRIQECIYYPELNDAFVKEEWNCDTVEDYKKSVRESLLTEMQNDADSMLTDDLWDSLMEESTLGDYTSEMYQAAENSLNSSLNEEATLYGFDITEYKNFSYETEEDWKLGVEEQLKSELAAQYILQKEKISDAKTGNEGIAQAKEIVKNYAKIDKL